MSDHTQIYNYLNEIIGLNIDSITPEIEKLRKFFNEEPWLDGKRNKILPEAKKDEFFRILIALPSGYSISNRKEIRRLIILIVLILDQLEYYNEPVWREYFQFRHKAFNLFLKHDFDAEAAHIYNELDELSRRAGNNLGLKKRLQNQLNTYKKLIECKFKKLSTTHEYNKLKFLHSIYKIIPEYVYNADLENKERSFFRIPFFKSVLDLVFTTLLFIVIYAINIIIVKGSNNDVFTFLLKGNFSFVQLTIGFFVIYSCFLLFKYLETQGFKNIWKNFFKGIIIICAVIFTQIYILDYQNREERKFFQLHKKHYHYESTTNKNIFLNHNYILVTKFGAIEKKSIMDGHYSDLNISKLFYKKMLEIKSSDSFNSENLHIDYYDQGLDISTESDFYKIYDQEKYDFIINGDYFNNNNDILVCNSCYIIDTIYKQLLVGIQKGLFDSNNKHELTTSYNYDPFNYYKHIFRLNKNTYSIDSTLCYNANYLPSSLVLNKIFPNDLSFISQINISPIIAYKYFNILINWAKLKDATNENKPSILNSLVTHIWDIQALCQQEDSSQFRKSNNNIELQIHLLLLKSFFINQQIAAIHRDPKFPSTNELNLWFQKTNDMGEALRICAKFRHLDEFEIDYLMTSYWFINFNKLAQELGLNSSLEDPSRNSITNKKENGLAYKRLCTRSVIKEIDHQITKYKPWGDSEYKSEELVNLYQEMKTHIQSYYKDESKY